MILTLFYLGIIVAGLAKFNWIAMIIAVILEFLVYLVYKND